MYRNGTGSVDRPASRQQEIILFGPDLPTRLQQVLDWVRVNGNYGATWKEIAADTGLHHGKVSSALTNLHRLGLVFATRQTRDRCHIYVHIGHRAMYVTEDVFDEPVRTQSAVKRAAVEAVAEAAHRYLTDPSLTTLTNLEQTVTVWRTHQ